MLRENIKQSFTIGFVLSIIFILAFLLYLPGLKGSFLFDDFPNLQGLENYTYNYNFEEAKKFVESGFSGPTGRPIALASFLPQAPAWPNDPYPFKLINLYIHLICGLLLYWIIFLLLKSYQYNKNKSAWIALATMAMWLLHPFMVSTVLYVIQRMAQLSLFFSLLAILGYLKGRSYLINHQIKAYLIMSMSIGFGTILATYSKENGALTPLLILVIEFMHPKGVLKPNKYWCMIFLWFPSVALGILLLKELNFTDNIWPNRNFNQKERLLTEARVLVDYLANLYIPQFEKQGLYQDGIVISKSIFNPITTFFSIITIIILIVLAFIYKNKYPLLSLAILFFFASHIMESTLLGLEIYFEHRNYVGAIFIFLPLATLIYYLYEHKNKKLGMLACIIVLFFLSFMTYERTKLWGRDNLKIYWAQNSPASPRAQYEIANYLISHNRLQQTEQFLELTVERLPESAFLNVYLLSVKMNNGHVKEQDFIHTYNRLKHQKFDVQAFKSIEQLVEIVQEKNIVKDLENTLNFLHKVDELQNVNVFYPYWRTAPYLQAKIYLQLDKPIEALQYYQESLKRINRVESGLKMVAEIASQGYLEEAKLMLDQVVMLKEADSIVYRNDIENLYQHLK